MSLALLTLIALTIVALGLIVALLLKIRSQRIAAQPVMGGFRRSGDVIWCSDGAFNRDELAPAEPEGKAKEEAGK